MASPLEARLPGALTIWGMWYFRIIQPLNEEEGEMEEDKAQGGKQSGRKVNTFLGAQQLRVGVGLGKATLGQHTELL